jgi:hypothetical protein
VGYAEFKSPPPLFSFPFLATIARSLRRLATGKRFKIRPTPSKGNFNYGHLNAKKKAVNALHGLFRRVCWR